MYFEMQEMMMISNVRLYSLALLLIFSGA